jgi:hypothetical protein
MDVWKIMVYVIVGLSFVLMVVFFTVFFILCFSFDEPDATAPPPQPPVITAAAPPPPLPDRLRRSSSTQWRNWQGRGAHPPNKIFLVPPRPSSTSLAHEN